MGVPSAASGTGKGNRFVFTVEVFCCCFKVDFSLRICILIGNPYGNSGKSCRWCFQCGGCQGRVFLIGHKYPKSVHWACIVGNICASPSLTVAVYTKFPACGVDGPGNIPGGGGSRTCAVINIFIAVNDLIFYICFQYKYLRQDTASIPDCDS